MELSRRAATAPAPTAATTQLPQSPEPQPSPPQSSPSFPPGFPLASFASRELALALFPQIRDIPDPDSSPARSTRSGSSFVPDSVEEVLATSSASDGQGKKVSFAPSLHVGAQPLVCIHGALRPCLKSAPKPAALNAAAADNPGLRAAPCPALSNSAAASSGSAAPKSPAFNAGRRSALHLGQHSSSASSDDSWQPVRAPYWWRSRSHGQRHSSRSNG